MMDYYVDSTNKNRNALREYMDMIGKCEVLTPEESLELIKKARKGDRDAREKVILCHLKLVYSVVEKNWNHDVPFLDMLQFGNETLTRLVDTFNIEGKNTFSGYAWKYVDFALRRYRVKDRNAVNYSYDAYIDIGKIKRFCDAFTQENNREATTKDIKEQFPDIKDDIIRLYFLVFDHDFVHSLDECLPDSDDATTYDMIGNEDKNYDVVLSRLTAEKLVNDILNLDIPARKKYAILYRYGFIKNKAHSLEKTGEQIGVTRVRIQQIEHDVFKKMKKLPGMENCK